MQKLIDYFPNGNDMHIKYIEGQKKEQQIQVNSICCNNCFTEIQSMIKDVTFLRNQVQNRNSGNM